MARATPIDALVRQDASLPDGYRFTLEQLPVGAGWCGERPTTTTEILLRLMRRYGRRYDHGR
jgi:hypothetical protein